MTLDPVIIDRIKQKIIGAKTILLLAHKNPDGDTIGAALACYHYFKGLAKDVDVGCYNAPAPGLRFLPGIEHVIHEIDDKRYDLIISFDSADPKLSGLDTTYPEIFSLKDRHINIDHHVSNLRYAGINLVVPECASTTQILYYLFLQFKTIFTREIATCLLTGLYTDTGSFMHQNTTSETLRVGAALLRYGADVLTLSQSFFQTKPIAQLQLWGLILERAKRTKDDVIVSGVTKSDLDLLKVDKEHISGVIEFLKYVPGIQYAEILTEENGGKIKGSLRTIREDVNVSKIAETFGGGGHVKAAGFNIKGTLKSEFQWKIIEDQGEQVVF